MPMAAAAQQVAHAAPECSTEEEEEEEEEDWKLCVALYIACTLWSLHIGGDSFGVTADDALGWRARRHGCMSICVGNYWLMHKSY